MDKDIINERLEYNPDTGVFINKTKRKGTKGIGKPAGTLTKKGYVDVFICGKKHGLHRIAFLIMTGSIPDNVDHINGVKSDNRWCNLRAATIRENAFNYNGRKSKSNLKGVYYDGRGNKKWTARVTTKEGVIKSFGYFYTAEEAHKVADLQRKREHGEFYCK